MRIRDRASRSRSRKNLRRSARNSYGIVDASSYFCGGTRQMKLKQSLMAALVGIAMMISMPMVAAARDRDADEYQNAQWQEPGAIVQVGHHYGWRNHANYSPGLICDEDGDDCHSSISSDDGDDCEDQYSGPSYYGGPAFNGRGRTYNSYDSNSGYDDAYDTPYSDNAPHGTMSTLAPLLQQFFR